MKRLAWMLSGVIVFLLTTTLSMPAFAADCQALFPATGLSSDLQATQARFTALTRSFTPDNNVDIMFEVPIAGKSVAEIEQIIADRQPNYFGVAPGSLSSQSDGFSQRYNSLDGEWRKTIKVTTHNIKGQPIPPYIQIFYEDQQGGVVRLKPFGNTDVPATLTHLRSPHGTLYFKKDPQGDLSWENEAFKVNGLTLLPKAPKDVQMPSGVVFGSPEAEAFLQQCWTFQTHVPLQP